MQQDYTSAPSIVYIIHAQGTDHVKIGTTTDLPGRLRSIQTGCPYRCTTLMTWPGGRRLEAFLHKKLAKYRRAGEWFALPAFPGKMIFDLVENFKYETNRLNQKRNRKEPKRKIRSFTAPQKAKQPAGSRQKKITVRQVGRYSFDVKQWKLSRFKAGFLIRRIRGYKITEDAYGVSYLGVLQWAPDRTTTDKTRFPLAGYSTWEQLAEMDRLRQIEDLKE